MITPGDLAHRFTYHPPKPEHPERYQAIRDKAHEFATLVNELAPDGREKSLSISHIEDAVMWANAGIARHG